MDVIRMKMIKRGKETKRKEREGETKFLHQVANDQSRGTRSAQPTMNENRTTREKMRRYDDDCDEDEERREEERGRKER